MNSFDYVHLTEESIKKAAGVTIFGRGAHYYQTGMVGRWQEEEPGRISGIVLGSGGVAYQTKLDLSSGRFKAWCSCPYNWSPVCKHAVALALGYLDSRVAGYPAASAASLPVAASAAEPAPWEEGPGAAAWQPLLEALVDPDGGSAEDDYPTAERLIYRLEIAHGSLLELSLRRARLGRRGLGKERSYAYDANYGSDFLRSRDRLIIGLAGGGSSYLMPSCYVRGEAIDPLLQLLAQEQYVFAGGSPDRVRIMPGERVGLRLAMRELGEDHEFSVEFDRDEIERAKERLFVLGGQRPWISDGASFYPLDTELGASSIRHLLKHPQLISPADLPLFMERYYGKLSAGAALRVESEAIGDIKTDLVPRPVVYLEGDIGRLLVKLCFAYGDGPPQVAGDRRPGVLQATRDGAIIWAGRQLEAEKAAAQILTEAGAAPGPDGKARLVGEAALDFLRVAAPELQQRGWEVVSESPTCQLRDAEPRVTARISSGIDWFDLDLAVDYHGVRAGIDGVLAAYRSGRRYLQLEDGSWGLLPLEWLQTAAAPLEELARLERVGPAGGSVKVAPYHVPLAAELIAGTEFEAIQSFHEINSRLASFEGIAPVAAPAGLVAELRDYQAVGLSWLGFLKSFSFGGILADDMGLGKTIQTLAHLLREKEQGLAAGPSLIVAPTSVAFNWEKECRRFAPGLSVLRLTGPDRSQRFGEIAAADLVITTYALVRRDFEALAQHSFHYVVLDEAQNIKNPAARTAKLCKRLPARHRLALTGTPIENNLIELWSIFDFLMPGLLGGPDGFREQYEKPIVKLGDQGALARLKGRVRPFILRRMKEDVAAELPPKTEIVSYCEMTAAQRTLYRQVLNTCRAQVFDAVNQKGIERSQITILDALLKLRQVCNHPQLVKVAGNKVKTSGKMELFQEMIEELTGEGHRALVFSQFTQMLAILRAWLDQKGIDYCYLDGRTRKRQEAVERFNGGGAPLFLISLKAGGTGLNLTAADYVIHVDPWWNPAVEDQATDRAHRLGQDKHVFVYKLITKESVEEKMLKLQQRKKDLAGSLLTAEAGLGKRLTREDLEELFVV